MSWLSYQQIARHPDVAWTIPTSLGDSHHGFRVMGTTGDYFRYYRFGSGHALKFQSGQPFAEMYETVVGADVASSLGYRVGDSVVIAHCTGNVSFSNHEDKPFQISGILAKTGTPVDRTVHVSLEAITAIHVDWQSGSQAPAGARISADQARDHHLITT